MYLPRVPAEIRVFRQNCFKPRGNNVTTAGFFFFKFFIRPNIIPKNLSLEISLARPKIRSRRREGRPALPSFPFARDGQPLQARFNYFKRPPPRPRWFRSHGSAGICDKTRFAKPEITKTRKCIMCTVPPFWPAVLKCSHWWFSLLISIRYNNYSK